MQDETGSQLQPQKLPIDRKLFWDIAGVVIVVIIAALGFLYYYTFVPPLQFTEPRVLTIDQGMSVKDISQKAKKAKLVHSDLMLYLVLTATADPTKIHAGRYIFNQPGSVFMVAKKIASQQVDDKLITLTLPEGITVEQMAKIAAASLENFDAEDYVEHSLSAEGYMFPDTYHVPESFTADQLHKLQARTFAEKVRPIESSVSTSTLKEYDPIILASIIEREANDEESMKMVSGILRNRLDLGMALQADATIEYVLDKSLNELGPGELAKILDTLDSPYNTYMYTGLPPTPIGNPGLMAIDAALNPTKSEFLFYVTGNDGKFYYAETLSEHNRNIDQYLR